MKVLSRKSILTILLTLLAVGMSLVVFRAVKKDSDLPVYEGKNVRQWFYGEDGNPGSIETTENAKLAFQAMGTNCVPYLIGKLTEKDTILAKVYQKLYVTVPPLIRDRLMTPELAILNRTRSLLHLQNLPRNFLDPFASEFIRLFPLIHNNDYLFNIFPYDLVKSVVIRIQNPKVQMAFFDSLLEGNDFMMSLDAAISLSKLDSTRTNGIQIFVKAITNRSSIVFPGLTSGAHMPTLPETLNDLTTRKQKEAHEALAKIAPELAEQYPLEAPQP